MTKRQAWQAAKAATEEAATAAARADGEGNTPQYNYWMGELRIRNEARRKAFNDYMASDEP